MRLEAGGWAGPASGDGASRPGVVSGYGALMPRGRVGEASGYDASRPMKGVEAASGDDTSRSRGGAGEASGYGTSRTEGVVGKTSGQGASRSGEGGSGLGARRLEAGGKRASEHGASRSETTSKHNALRPGWERPRGTTPRGRRRKHGRGVTGYDPPRPGAWRGNIRERRLEAWGRGGG
ncbi:uncharacterized protein LOC125827314 [Solanum verrucosum]|uniref:uncharacterized protein LOC125827314 n=1 Tax=Solanum verrucosum TaxID=315347 RepID=UPI0020D123F9|nr:uncharacterized protein LOC125827314 [Solanum verrucosum]